MTKNDCFELGKIAKTHGLKGELSLWLDVDNPYEYEEMDSFFIELKGQLVPHFIEKISIRPALSIVKLEEIDTFEQAEPLVGASVYLPLNSLPELEDDQFYFHEIVDFKIIDQNKGELGTVNTVYAMEVQELISMIYQQKEVLIPITDSIVTKVDKIQKIVHVNLPEGLIEVYLND